MSRNEAMVPIATISGPLDGFPVEACVGLSLGRIPQHPTACPAQPCHMGPFSSAHPCPLIFSHLALTGRQTTLQLKSIQNTGAHLQHLWL